MVELLPNKYFFSNNGSKAAIFLLVLLSLGFLISCSSTPQDVPEQSSSLVSPESISKSVQDAADKASTDLLVDSYPSRQQSEILVTGEKNIDKSRPMISDSSGITQEDNSEDVTSDAILPARVDGDVESRILKSYEKEGFYENAKVQIRGKYLPELVPGYQDTALGLQAPEIKGSDLNGGDIYVGGEGPTTLIMVLAHWCPHCRNEVRELSPFLNETDSLDRVRIVTLLTSINEERANFPPHTWLDLEKWPVPSIVDTPSSQIANAYGVNSFPFFIVVNDKGKVVLRLPGRLGVETLVKLLDAIDEMDETGVEN
ncbi:MAG: TlpA family protein disulfide reductase [Dehalococcoidia bacterium]|tara:strand:+ start:908 stop:1849 length:942 start_codon:yes stop_codon:yes gene_type:complete